MIAIPALDLREGAREHLAAARIERDHEPSGPARRHVRKPRTVFHRARADHGARSPRGERTLDRRIVAQAAAHLGVARPRVEHARDERGLFAASGGRVEIHDVQRAEARRAPAARHGERVGLAHALVFVRAAHELHARAFAQVECRDRDHRRTSRVPVTAASASRRNASPGALLFSGWNCAPIVFATRTTDGNRSSS